MTPEETQVTAEDVDNKEPPKCELPIGHPDDPTEYSPSVGQLLQLQAADENGRFQRYRRFDADVWPLDRRKKRGLVRYIRTLGFEEPKTRLAAVAEWLEERGNFDRAEWLRAIIKNYCEGSL
jgi:hypothetical protein